MMGRLIMSHVTEGIPCRDHRKHTTHYHVAVIVKRGKVIAQANNKVGTRSRGCGFSDRTIHAERAVVKQLGDISKLRGASLCVWRISSMSVLPSKPCEECHIFLTKCMKEYGLRAVYYQDTVIPI